VSTMQHTSSISYIPSFIKSVIIKLKKIFSGNFATLQKAIISFVMSVSLCPSTRMGLLGSHWTDSNETDIPEFFKKILFPKHSSLIKI
jgi:hypothetical protein